MAERATEEPIDRAEKTPYQHGEKPESWWDFKASHWVTAILTIAIVGVGYLQYRVYGRQAGIMDEQVKIAASQSRPWVGLSNAFIGPISRSTKLELSARIKNSGGSPALQMTVCAASDTPNASQIGVAGIKQMMKKLDDCPNQAKFFLLPNAEIGMDVSRAPELMTQTVIDDVMADRATFAVFGRIAYTAPTDGHNHWTTFCALYIRANNSFSACTYGNETDDAAVSGSVAGSETNESSAKIDNWSDPITIFTGLLVIVGALQVLVYFKQKSIMEKALQVGRRPRILIREMTLREIPNSEDKLQIDCYVVNAGDATATMLGSFADIQCVRLRNWQSKPVVINMGLNNILKSGEHFIWSFEVRPGDATPMALAQTRDRPGEPDENYTNLYVRGLLLYKDAMGIERRTGVWRVLNASTDRFRRVKGARAEGYEHAD